MILIGDTALHKLQMTEYHSLNNSSIYSDWTCRR